MRRIALAGIIVALAAAIGGYAAYNEATRPEFALEVDATRDTTDISGTHYRIRVTNAGTQQLTGIVAEMGPGDVEETAFLDPGQSYYFYPSPGPDTKVSAVKVRTNEGIEVVSDYRTPTKVLGLPGGGR